MKKTLAIIISIMVLLPCLMMFSASAAESTVIYIDDINSANTSQTGPILLYGEGKSAASFGLSNYDWWDKVIAKFDSATGAFIINEIFPAAGGDFSYASAVLEADEVMIWTFEWDGFGFGSVLENMSVGDKLYLYGFDFTNAAATEMLSGGTSSIYVTTYTPSMGDGYYGYVIPSEPEEPEIPEPEIKESNVVSLGAKVNTEKYGLRMGATLTKDNARGEVIGLGMLVVSKDIIGDNTLDLDYAAVTDTVVDVKARSIDNYVEGQEFEDYESVTYYVTILGLEDYADEDIVARPYVIYRSKSGVQVYYGDTMVRNYSDVAAATVGE